MVKRKTAHSNKPSDSVVHGSAEGEALIDFAAGMRGVLAKGAKNSRHPHPPGEPKKIDLATLSSNCSLTVRAAIDEHLEAGRSVFGLDASGKIVETRR